MLNDSVAVVLSRKVCEPF